MAGLVPVGIRLVAAGLDVFQQAGITVARTVAEITEGIRDIPSVTRGAGQSIDELQGNIQKLQLSLNGLRNTQVNSVLNNFKLPREVSQEIANTSQSLRFLQGELKNAQAAGSGGNGIGSAIVSGLKGAGDAVGSFVSVASKITIVTGIVTALVGALANLVGGFSALEGLHFSANIDREFTFIKAVLQATDEQMAGLRKTAASVVSALPTPIQAIIGQIRELGRAGVAIDEITSSAAKLATSLSILAKGEASPEKIAESLAAGQKAFASQGDTLNDVAKSILGIANATRLSIPEVLNGFNKLAPIAQILHLTSAEVGAFIGVIGAAGLRGEEAGTGIRNFFLRLQNPSREGAQAIKQFAPNLTLFNNITGEAKKPIEVIQQLQEAFGDAAIASGKLTEQQRAFALSEIFQTRAASIAALAIIQGTDAYNQYLAIISETDPLKQAAEATDNLADKALIIKNKFGIAINELISQIIPGLKSFADSLDNTLGAALQEDSPIFKGIALVGRAIASIASGQGIGELKAAIEDAAGPRAAALFEEVALAAESIKRAIVDLVIPAVLSLVANLKDLALDVAFDPGKVNSVGSAIVHVIAFTAGLIQSFADLVKEIDNNKTAILEFGITAANVIGGVAKLASDLASNLSKLRDITPAPPVGFAPEDITPPEGSDNKSPINRLGDAAAKVQSNFEDVATSAAKLQDQLDKFKRNEAAINSLSHAATGLKNEIGTLEQLQLAPTGADVSQQLQSKREQLVAIQAEIEARRGASAQASQGLSIEERVKAVTDALTRALTSQVDKFDDLAQAQRDANAQAAAIKANNERLQESYESLTREVGKAVRETQDKVNDLNTRTQESLDKLAETLKERVADIRERLAEANSDAREAFDFGKIIRDQRTGLSRETEDLGTILSRRFDDERTLVANAQQDRDTMRQRNLQLEQDAARQQVDIQLEAHQRINEDLERSFQEQNQDRQRALERSQELVTKELQTRFDAENTIRTRGQEDAKRQLQLGRELAKAKPADRANIIANFAQQSVDLATDRDTADKELKIHKEQEKQLDNLRKRQQDDQLKLQRNLAAQELTLRRGLADDEKQYRIQKELEFQLFRFGLEDQFSKVSRALKAGDLQNDRSIQQRETNEKRNLADSQQVKDDAIRETEFQHDHDLRERGADRETTRATNDARKRAKEILEQYGIDFDKLTRDRQQQLTDILERANQQSVDLLRKQGVNSPAISAFNSNVNSLIGGASAANAAAIAAGRGNINVPANIAAGAQPQTAPELLIAGLGLSAAALSLDIPELTKEVVNLIIQLRTRRASGADVEIDSFVNNGIFVGDGAVEQFFRQAAGPLGDLLAPKAGN